MGVLGGLDSAPFEDLIRDYGEVPSFWQQYLGPCPNPAHVDSLGGASPLPSCPVCGGTGSVYRAATLPTTGPTGGKVATAAFGEVPYAAQVELQAGDLFCAFLESEYPFSEEDRLGLPSRRLDAAEFRVRGTGGGDRLRFAPAAQILTVIVGATPTPLAASNYSLSGDGTQIQFSGGVTAGQQYAVRYRWTPSWIFAPGSFQKFPQATNGDYFPTLAVLRLFGQGALDRKSGAP